MRGIRGAITIKNDTESEIVAAVRWMVTEMIRHNGVKPEDIGAVIFRSGWGREPWVRSSEAPFVSSRPGITSESWRIRIVRGCSICSINFLRIWK